MTQVMTGRGSRRFRKALLKSFTHFSFAAALIGGGIGLPITTYQAHAIPIPAGAAVKGVETRPGLRGEYHNYEGPFTNASALLFAREARTFATFDAIRIDYPATELTRDRDTVRNVSVASFLSRNARNLSADASFNFDVATSLFYFTGFLDIRTFDDVDAVTPGIIDMRFALASDDGSLFRIAGLDIVSVNGQHPFRFGPVAEVEFEAPGLYPIEIIYYNNTAHAGVELFSTICCGPNAGGPRSAPHILHESRLRQRAAPVPEPSALLLSLGGLGLLGYLRRRKSKTTS